MIPHYLSLTGSNTRVFVLHQMFQVVHSEKPLYVQAGNCVEASEWLDVLGQVSRCNVERLTTFHPSNYTGGAWQCCKNQSSSAPGCKPCTMWVFSHITSMWTRNVASITCCHSQQPLQSTSDYLTETASVCIFVFIHMVHTVYRTMTICRLQL